MFDRMLTTVLAVSITCSSALACSGTDKDVHVPTDSQESSLGSGSVGAPCTVPEGGDGTDTTQCPYFACYCKGGNEGVLCTDYCHESVCRDAGEACAVICRNAFGVDHIGPATHAVCD